jgi:hypothetical protein
LEKIRIQELKQAHLESGTQREKGKIRQVTAPRCTHLFTENPWGAKARRSVQATEKLDDNRWQMILQSALTHVDHSLDHDLEVSSDTMDENDHAMVDLNW